MRRPERWKQVPGVSVQEEETLLPSHGLMHSHGLGVGAGVSSLTWLLSLGL